MIQSQRQKQATLKCYYFALNHFRYYNRISSLLFYSTFQFIIQSFFRGRINFFFQLVFIQVIDLNILQSIISKFTLSKGLDKQLLMKTFQKILLISFFICLGIAQQSQQCLDQKGKPVDWWVILNIPGKTVDPVGTFINDKGNQQNIYNYPGYAYYDSNDHKAGRKSFQVNEAAPDGKNTALERTLRQIKKTNMNVIAWNDQPCNGDVKMGSTSAHAKAIGAYNQHSKRGFFISHSIPRYPCFNDAHEVNVSIRFNQQLNGQNMLCVSGDEQFLKNMISKVPPMLPNVYEQNYDCNTLFGSNSGNCESLPGSNGIDTPDWTSTFSDFDYKMSSGIDFKMIFKRSDKDIKQSILDQGVTQMLQSSIVSQTWHGKSQSLVCPRGFQSQTVVKIKLNEKYSWGSSIDHSKWIIATDNNYVCYGDMNREKTQLPRGGAFYCLNSQGLHAAMWNLVNFDGCINNCGDSDGSDAQSRASRAGGDDDQM